MVVADEEVLDVHALVQEVADELLGSELSDLLGEVDQEAGIDAHEFELVESLLKRVDEQQWEIGLQDLARMVGKGHHGRLCAVPLCLGFEVLQEELMSAVNAIKKTDASGKLAVYMIEFLVYCHFFVQKICFYQKKALSSRREFVIMNSKGWSYSSVGQSSGLIIRWS